MVLLLGTAACSAETSHADPPCAFDETGCIPFDLVVDVRAGPDGPSAVLEASSPTETWMQRGVPGTGTVIPSTEPGRIAPRIEIAIAGDADQAELRIVRIVSPAPQMAFEVVRRLELGQAPRIVRLENGERYVLRVTASLPGSEAGFSFLVRVP